VPVTKVGRTGEYKFGGAGMSLALEPLKVKYSWTCEWICVKASWRCETGTYCMSL
jgi:hypothetical protein